MPSVDVFYDQLSPYGTWYDDPTYGWVFTPSDNGYVPYTNGRWTNTDYGFTWVSRWVIARLGSLCGIANVGSASAASAKRAAPMAGRRIISPGVIGRR